MALRMWSSRFQLTLPEWGATEYSRMVDEEVAVSTHAPRVGSDLGSFFVPPLFLVVSTHAPRVGSDAVLGYLVIVADVSTHAPRAGSDTSRSPISSVGTCFNSRSPSGERRSILLACAGYIKFQLTLPEWGATASAFLACADAQFQLTLPEWGATVVRWQACHLQEVSTHAPRVGSDLLLRASGIHQHVSTHAPRVGSDLTTFLFSTLLCVSTHAPRVGSDELMDAATEALSSFNSRSPSGERPGFISSWGAGDSVSTHAPRVGSDARLRWILVYRQGVSTHAPRVGSDAGHPARQPIQRGFNSRSPSGERPREFARAIHHNRFNSRSPSGERQTKRRCSP